MIKYPRTCHLEGSRLQIGDEDLSQVPWGSLKDAYLVIEEKIDGANSGLSFGEDGELLLQSRGHYLAGGAREKHFALFKTWAAAHTNALREILRDRYIMFGEWVYAKHTVYYDLLPHYFLEFDIYDKQGALFLDTASRHALIAVSPVISVPVVARGLGRELPEPSRMVTRSLYKSDNWRERLKEEASIAGLDADRVVRETDMSDDAEGIYIKVEKDGRVIDRLKWVRHSFLSTVVESESHWLNRPILPNKLRPGVDIFGGA